jgi:large subunit ribosomal protein L21
VVVISGGGAKSRGLTFRARAAMLARLASRAFRPLTRAPSAASLYAPTGALPPLFSRLATGTRPSSTEVAPVNRKEVDKVATRFAVMELAGVQHKVAVDDLISSELLPIEVGGKLKTNRVLLIGERDATILGSPLIGGASVLATVEEQAFADKVIVFKKKRRKGYRRWKGHRQRLTLLRINAIELPDVLEAQLAATAGSN